MSFALTLKSLIVDRHSNESVMLRYAESGNKALLTKLYTACGDDLYHFVLTLSEPILAQDICQKTWLKVMEKKHLFRDSGQFKAWLFTLARNLLIDELRQGKPMTGDINSIHDNSKALDTKHEQSDIHGVFEQTLLSLSFEQREAFCLQQEGFSLQDIANITHCGIETVKSRLRYAKQHLSKQLEKYAETDHD
ncbi:RNA polymerase sigma factor [Paraglaciecola marina]|uniref:RNA polymerase sigma factor n=1 Tax=Paraglaciecola marina TaxID=2500157 RepID=UPI001EF08312|nr:sigma-70 family RNA polymerase sigma factor [Paraglaciecola marina]